MEKQSILAFFFVFLLLAIPFTSAGVCGGCDNPNCPHCNPGSEPHPGTTAHNWLSDAIDSILERLGLKLGEYVILGVEGSP
ncbi:MAG: hypothetical protein ABH864_06600 [archaeon]